MKKLLLVMAMVLAIPAMAMAGAELKENIEVIGLDTMTIDSQYTDYGDWERACSTLAIIEALDSGYVLITFSGTAIIPQGKSLYVGIDTLGSLVDTIWGKTKVSAPASRTYSYLEVPFLITKTLLIDSTTGAAADTNMWGSGEFDTIPIVVGTMATSGSTFKISVKDLMLKTEFFYQGDD